nr:Chain A, PrP peptide [synthetic construct]4W5P_B Chain B, PrP peptide [synthetic construct]
GGYVLGS